MWALRSTYFPTFHLQRPLVAHDNHFPLIKVAQQGERVYKLNRMFIQIIPIWGVAWTG